MAGELAGRRDYNIPTCGAMVGHFIDDGAQDLGSNSSCCHFIFNFFIIIFFMFATDLCKRYSLLGPIMTGLIKRYSFLGLISMRASC